MKGFLGFVDSKLIFRLVKNLEIELNYYSLNNLVYLLVLILIIFEFDGFRLRFLIKLEEIVFMGTAQVMHIPYIFLNPGLILSYFFDIDDLFQANSASNVTPLLNALVLI